MDIKNDFKLNVVPLIDVMLVLLAIVLTAASFIEYSKINITLPDSNPSLDKEDLPKEKIELTLDANGEISINERVIDMDDLRNELNILQKDQFILFKGDKEAQFGKFVDILQLLKEFELQNFLIMTRSKT
ncbi:biopolymer transporter ExbD [Campylobacter sp. CCUG 57310]|uniref:ExbD/TolR family protein n=1 Tax=Campylobacter sp. CCUG 57310 TaxID=2517362 RepID=UPI001564002A|nr:biopolymer transporter ExbD [Campylobacter sp. CCUG 57310]QKF93119.1 TonB system transport protein ExbD [Campylobacter sp. CCUG 57310]